jgi:glycosyltransferase involved in cell wall biosynthesis
MNKVSVVTISYNQAPFLERAIQSVLNQAYDNIEYIVVDPGSTDGSRQIIQRYGTRLDRVIFEPDRGPADGLNKGFGSATGDIFGYLNADDEYLPGCVGGAVEALNRQRADLVYGDGYIVDGDGARVRRCRSTEFSLRRFVLGSVVVMQQATFFRADGFRETGGFNIDNRTCWDGELLLDFALRRKKIVHIPAPWARFRIHDGSISGSERMNAEYNRDRIRLCGHLQAEYGAVLPVFKMLARIEKYLVNPLIALDRLEEVVFLKRHDRKSLRRHPE